MKAVLLLAFAAVALAGTYVPVASRTFCGVYTAATHGTVNNDTNQLDLLGSVVDKTALGCTAGVGGCSATVVGLYNRPLNGKYFNGSYGNGIPDYGNPANAAAYAALRLKLVNFFALALGCTLYQPPGTYIPANMYGVHAAMNLNTAIMTEFITVLVSVLASVGVTLGVATDPLSEIAYLGALTNAMGAPPGIACTATNPLCTFAVCGNPLQCAAATDFHQYVNTALSDGWADALTPSTTQDASIVVGGNINWRFGTAHNVLQADAAGGATTAGGFTSGALGVGGTYTRNFPTAGTYYFKCGAHAVMTGTITVTGSGVAGLTASVTVLAAAILAALALRQ